MKNFNRLFAAIAALALSAAFAVPAFAADTFVTLCSPAGSAAAGNTVTTRDAGNYVSDANGCVALDITKDVNGKGMSALLQAGYVAHFQNICAGQATLVAGAKTVTNVCFSGATNVVLCTDTTAANAVKCVAANGSLAIAGTTTDVISYARVQ